MKFLYFGDRHNTPKTPSNRIDNFQETCKLKDQEIINLAKKYNVKAFLHPGDFWNEVDVNGNNNFINSVINTWTNYNLKDINNAIQENKDIKTIMSQIQSNIPLIGIAGNHDLIANNINSLKDTTTGLLNSLGIFNLVSKDNPIFFTTEDGIKIAITGTNYHLNMDTPEYIDDYIVKEKLGDVHIHIVHGMLSNKNMGSLIRHTLIDNIIDTKADITLCGHNHIGFGIININGKYFINNGNVIRCNNDIKEFSRIPSVILLDITKNGINVKEIPLTSAKNGIEVLDRTFIEDKIKKEKALSKFQEETRNMKISSKPDMKKFVEDIATNKKIPDEIKNDIIDKLTEKEKKFIRKKGIKSNTYIKNIRLINYQSHKNSFFELSPNFNVFVGESRQGKSAILRALFWIYEGKTVGKEKSFIRKGADFAKVELTLSDNTKISRFIENKKNGKNGYEIIYPDGTSETGNTRLLETVQKLLGFSNFEVDDKLNISVNFMKQGDGWYLIGDKYSAGDKARIIGALNGTNLSDAVIRDLDSANLKTVASFKVSKDKVEELNTELKDFDYITEAESNLNKINDLINTYKDLQNKKNNIIKLSNDINHIKDYY